MRRVALILLTIAGMIVATWVGLRWRAPSELDNALSFSFVGLTNNPTRTMSPGRIAGASSGSGLHALFAVTNRSESSYVQFGIDRIESREGFAWKDHASVHSSPALGLSWAPGYGCWYAIPWPPAVPTNSAWRLVLWIKHEPALIFRIVNQRIGHEVFSPYGQGISTSSIVTVETDPAWSRIGPSTP